MNWLNQIIDDTFERMSLEKHSMSVPDHDMPIEMRDHSIEKESDWIGWKPIKTNLTLNDFKSFELAIGFNLPSSYKYFLSYKYFYKLNLINPSINFPTNLPEEGFDSLKEFMFGFSDGKELFEKGYLYFADFYDYGYLCFNANKEQENHEYEILYFDHEEIETPHLYCENFKKLLESDAEFGNRFIVKLNEYYEKN